MIDYAKITFIAGNGGMGGGSFEHVKGKRRGKADGGDGGGGGNVFVAATNDLNTLEPFRYIKEYKAKNGGSGLSKRRKGAQGEDLIVKVPVGTLVKVESQNDKPGSNDLIFDLDQEGQKILIARGGEGGRGNSHLRDEYGRRPKSGERGQEGEEVSATLELKLIADVGLVGLPNAGKSTLLSKITKAQPKVASYPFTTLEPNLGVLDVKGNSFREKSLVIADIPGLIEGASQGKGLGDLFLRHIERTKIIVHMIDISDLVNTDDLKERYETVRRELKAYSKELMKKREIIVLSKIDLAEGYLVEDFIAFFKAKRKKVLQISAHNGEGLLELVSALTSVSKSLE